ncbi:hypothetical protein GTZ99_04770 [Novosphingobium sp. FSY-8]|uniref:Permuted papain-like amidase YaeF/Yiix C92 family enzyme n=1 Tax=Novosphingobium ovatum TaxID=1908523 RepID=A0ABW9XBG7_9SPHN|nr:YiiX/YebB-like N1pC/P60 family cysteine hydrolase [Novosphingobium ovatum]NBC35866.1 hypothetical protein [Novosphingobium ovatum]
MNIDDFGQNGRSYEDIRASIKTGDVLFCSGSALFSDLIKFATKSPISHVGFVIRFDAIDRIMVMESVESIGVRSVPLSSYVRDYCGTGKPYPGKLAIGRHAAFPDGDAGKIKTLMTHSVDLLGHRYDNAQIGKIAMRIMAGAAGLHIGDVIKPDKDFICSEYVADAYASIDIHLPRSAGGFVAPADVAKCGDIALLSAIAI